MSILILALDTSHSPGSVAFAEGLADEAAIRVDQCLPSSRTTAQSFAIEIRNMLHSIGSRPRDICLVAANIGPGSFTGLRIAATFAKTFAYATGADVLGVGAMDVLAHQAAAMSPAPLGRLWTLVDAHRGQLFAALYTNKINHDNADTKNANSLRVLQEPQMVEIDRWLGQVEGGDLLTGPIVERLASRLPAGVKTVGSTAGTPSAAAVAEIAWRRWQSGERDDLWRLRPLYIRRSAAEERRDK